MRTIRIDANKLFFMTAPPFLFFLVIKSIPRRHRMDRAHSRASHLPSYASQILRIAGGVIGGLLAFPVMMVVS
jgi:hypothetical protein